MSPETKRFIEKYWMAIMIFAIPIITGLWFISATYDSGVNDGNYEDNPSIHDPEWQKDTYGGTGVEGW